MAISPPSSKLPAPTHPPKKPSNPGMVVVEATMIATEFAKDFEKLMEAYNIEEYDVVFKGAVFQLRFQKKKGD